MADAMVAKAATVPPWLLKCRSIAFVGAGAAAERPAKRPRPAAADTLAARNSLPVTTVDDALVLALSVPARRTAPALTLRLRAAVSSAGIVAAEMVLLQWLAGGGWVAARVLQLGSGCGLAGIAAHCILQARCVPALESSCVCQEKPCYK